MWSNKQTTRIYLPITVYLHSMKSNNFCWINPGHRGKHKKINIGLISSRVQRIFFLTQFARPARRLAFCYAEAFPRQRNVEEPCCKGSPFLIQKPCKNLTVIFKGCTKIGPVQIRVHEIDSTYIQCIQRLVPEMLIHTLQSTQVGSGVPNMCSRQA